ncbi:unnamed protein product [Pneumocystis jirovecii]|uniref:Uncharacterized protein n=1 Tax=Pneumocystis jirovecii TaxID=42068 RepID=L0PH57_PNEJI|nr:unnamed protein product [Pneumocystis jirovecii]
MSTADSRSSKERTLILSIGELSVSVEELMEEVSLNRDFRFFDTVEKIEEKTRSALFSDKVVSLAEAD